MLDEYDVIIVGGGPAGLSCAIELQKADLSVLLLEKNGAIGPKVCAGGITTKIKDVDIPLDTAEVLFSSINVSFLDKKVSISQENIPFVGTIDREKLGEFLLKRISDKVTVKTNCNVSQVGDDFIVADGQRIRYKYLVGADGSHSIVRKFLGLKNNKFITAIQYLVSSNHKNLEFFIDIDLFGSGYAWIFPHQSYTSIGCGQGIRNNQPSDLSKNFVSWLEKKKISVAGLKLQGWTINIDYRGFEFGNKFLVGDAGGFASGLTGEGIYFALVSGREVARKILDPKYKCRKIIEILRIKRHHERAISFISFLIKFNKILASSFIKFSLNLARHRWFAKKLINNYG
ncbi:MAG: NAD(P)/FAD-dependent oxidoreductase [Patescibacteria group bacterium]